MVKTMKDGHVAETGYKPIVWNAAAQAVREAAHNNQVSIFSKPKEGLEVLRASLLAVRMGLG
jgi:hypothetical protein